ncbi:MAG: mismatch-specific DNA-glycosylase [Solirubrobacterales bacterium]
MDGGGQTHFAHPGNRFYPALATARIIGHEIDRTAGMSDADRAHVVARGIGITNLVQRATARAAELSRDELREGGERLRGFVAEHRPRVVAIAGITAYREAFGQLTALAGRQPDTLESAAQWAGAAVWVVPNPSGLNAHETVATLAAAYAAPAVEAGVIAGRPRPVVRRAAGPHARSGGRWSMTRGSVAWSWSCRHARDLVATRASRRARLRCGGRGDVVRRGCR